MKSGQISEDVIQRKVDTVRAMLSCKPSQAQVSSAASFIHHGYITEVKNMRLVDINLSEAHASSLADVNVTDYVFINNVGSNIAPILSRIKCKWLSVWTMRLSSEDTAALVQGMQTSVERVRLGWFGSLELDWDTFLTYDGQGHCGKVMCEGETRRRYGDQLATWGETMGWSVKKTSYYVSIYKIN